MSLNISIPKDEPMVLLTPQITVIGVGGAGGNAINTMIDSELKGARFVAANTDAQALSFSLADCRIQLGLETTKGLGSGMSPEVGKAAAEEAIDKIIEEIKDANMLFIAAGMGGGTGTGAAPVIAKAARDLDILTVGVVTKPFNFEGSKRMELAERGVEELSKYVDTLIIIPNQNLFRVATEKTSFVDAFKTADHVLYSGVRNITDLIMVPGLINLDFADVRAVVKSMGRAMMGSGEAVGENRAIDAANAAITNQLLDDNSMKGAKGVLINITGGPDLTLMEVDEAAERIKSEVDVDANIKFGTCLDPSLKDIVRVSVIATGITGGTSSTSSSSNVRGEDKAAGFGSSINKNNGADLLRKSDLFNSPRNQDKLTSAKEELDRILSRVQKTTTAPKEELKPAIPSKPFIPTDIEENPLRSFAPAPSLIEDEADMLDDNNRTELTTKIVSETVIKDGEVTFKETESRQEKFAPKIEKEHFIPEINEEASDPLFAPQSLFASEKPLMSLYANEQEEEVTPMLSNFTEPEENLKPQQGQKKSGFINFITEFTLGKHKEISEKDEEESNSKDDETGLSSEDLSIPSYLRRS